MPREILGMAAAGPGEDLLLANELIEDAPLRAVANSGARPIVAVDSDATIDAASRGLLHLAVA